MNKKNIRVMNLNPLPKVQWEYVMAILRTKNGPMHREEVIDHIFQDDGVDPGFRAQVTVNLLNCPATVPC